MIYGFYFRFLIWTHNRALSIILSRIAYLLLCIRFNIKRCFRRKRTVSISKEEALQLVKNLYSPKDIKIEYTNKVIDPAIDLSIVVPVYNYKEQLRENIDSILQQKTKFVYELILVDDGSTDGSGDILKEYEKDPRVKVIYQENQGIGGARNTGINNAVGKYLMFAACDDILHSDIVEKLMSTAFKNDNDIVICGHNLVKYKEGKVTDIIPNIYPDRNLFSYKKKDTILNYPGLPWCKVYKRQLFFKVRYFAGYWFEDTIIHFLIFTQCQSYSYIREALYDYRWYEKNFSHVQGEKSNIRAVEFYWLLLKILDQYKEIGLPEDERFYIVLLKPLSAYYYPKIRGLNDEMVDALFVLAQELLTEYKPLKPYRLPYVLRITEKALLSGDIELWKIASRNQ